LSEQFQSDVVFFLGFALAIVALPMGTLLLMNWIRPTAPEAVKLLPYESGVPQSTAPRRPFHMAYYNFALVFIVFEVETVLLFAIAPVLKETGWLALLEVGAFVALVALSLVYAWRKGALVWR
jgi:NADH:ubiquinone oxidoreductase subunit 3 (subunit A)